MWEVLFAEIVKSIIVPELMELIKRRYNETGEWPTKIELDALVDQKRDAIKEKGLEFLNRINTPVNPVNPVDSNN